LRFRKETSKEEYYGYSCTSIIWKPFISLYFNKGERECVFLQFGSRIWGDLREIGILYDKGNCEPAEDRLVENELLENGLLPKEWGGCGFNEGIVDGKENNCEETENKTFKVPEIENFLKSFPCSPPSLCFESNAWNEHPRFVYKSINNEFIQSILRKWNWELRQKSIEDLWGYYSGLDFNHCLFRVSSNPFDYYYDLAESTNIMVELLEFQFSNDQEKILEFIRSLHRILEKKLPKKNTMVMIAPPSSGKNFFFDTILHYFLNFGQIGNFNKHSTGFPLQEAVNRRILLWNEPVFESSAEETMKMIFGGDTCNVKVKFSRDANLQRTPVIVLSNSNNIPRSLAFTDRCFFYTWKRAPYLIKYTKKPNPLCTYLLFISE